MEHSFCKQHIMFSKQHIMYSKLYIMYSKLCILSNTLCPKCCATYYACNIIILYSTQYVMYSELCISKQHFMYSEQHIMYFKHKSLLAITGPLPIKTSYDSVFSYSITAVSASPSASSCPRRAAAEGAQLQCCPQHPHPEETPDHGD